LFGALLVPALAGAAVNAASCVRISGGNFDAPGNDNYSSALNGEYIRIRNYCSAPQSLSRWRLSDFNTIHTFSFSTTFRLAGGATVTVYTGRGTNSATRLYWGRGYGAVWNNTPPERAYLRNSAGAVQSTWSEY
jgi:hypothetical protein